MWESLGGVAAVMAGGIFGFRHLNSRINRVEDKANDHLAAIDEKLSDQNREIGEVKAIVERIEKSVG